MAHKKGVGSTDNGRDSNSKRLGVKLFGGELALAGNIIIRQRGTKFHPGDNVYMGKDFTLHAKVDGTVSFLKKKYNRTYVNILPINGVDEIVAKAAPKAKAVTKTPVEKAAPVVEKAAPKVKAVTKTPVEKAAPVVEKAAPVVKEEQVAAAPVAAAPKKEPKAEKAATPAKKEVKPKTSKTEKITLPSGKKIKLDDLKMVEGVGPKIEGLLQQGGIQTWADLANAPAEKVQAILDEAGPRYKMHSPATWAKQAELADAGKWEELEAYQDKLKGGREVK